MNLAERRQAILDQVRDYAEVLTAGTPFRPSLDPVPVSGKVLGPEEYVNLVDASLDGWLTTGRFNDELERRLAEFIGCRLLRTVNSGSSANLLALAALTSPRLGYRALKPGDEVLTVAAGFPTTVNPILLYGLTPVFVDIRLPSYNVDVEQLATAVTAKTRAVVLAHTLGNPFNLDAVMALAQKHDLWVVEDCCDALGSTYRGRQVGTFGHLGTLSFYPAHHITTGEGGAVFTDDAELAQIVESLRDWGRDCRCPPGHDNRCGKRFSQHFGSLPFGYDHKYVYSELGYNLKLTDMQAACGLAQLSRLESFGRTRRRNFDFLKKRLAKLTGCILLPESTPGSDPSWFGFPVCLEAGSGIKRVDLLRYLDRHRIATRLLFGGNLTRQPYFLDRQYRLGGPLAQTDRATEDAFWLGIYPGLTEEMLEYVGVTLEGFFDKFGNHRRSISG